MTLNHLQAVEPFNDKPAPPPDARDGVYARRRGSADEKWTEWRHAE
jgi:hypothetical protein